MAVLVGRKVTGNGGQQAHRRTVDLGMLVSTQEGLLHDLIGGFARAHEAPDVAAQRRAALLEEPRKEFVAGVGHRLGSPFDRHLYASKRGVAILQWRLGVFGEVNVWGM